MKIILMKNILDANQQIADENRINFAKKNITCINVMASPGAGKTSIIVKLIELLKDKFPMYVIEGDIASSIDSEKIEKLKIPVIQINTGGGCHLDANMVKKAIEELNVKNDSIVFIENVGNLVCPSAFDLGENIKMVVASVPEGDDKPYKYVCMFEMADIVVLNKTDLIEHVDFNMENFKNGVWALNQKIPIFEVSCTKEFGIDKLADKILKEALLKIN